MIDPSTFGMLNWAATILGVLAIVISIVTGYLYHRERRRAAEAVDQLTGPDIALVEKPPNDEEVRSGDLGDYDPEIVSDGGQTARALADKVQLNPPKTDGTITSLLATWRHRVKSKKLARKGYIRWYKIDAQLHRPQWVKPFRNGDGQPVYYSDGDPYWFPRDALVTDAQTGAFVAAHQEGDADPINLRDPMMPGLPTDRLQEAIELSVESDEPGFFDKHDLDSSTIIAIGIASLLILGAVGKLIGGGI